MFNLVVGHVPVALFLQCFSLGLFGDDFRWYWVGGIVWRDCVCWVLVSPTSCCELVTVLEFLYFFRFSIWIVWLCEVWFLQAEIESLDWFNIVEVVLWMDAFGRVSIRIFYRFGVGVRVCVRDNFCVNESICFKPRFQWKIGVAEQSCHR